MKKRILFFTILFLSIGFAAVATNLFINGNILIGTNESDFDVYFSDAYVDGREDLSLISQDKKIINFVTKPLSKVGDKSILEYEVTNASTQYDANVSVTCTPNETDLYKVNNTQDKEIIEARSIGNGTVTVELKKNVLEEMNISFKCTITASAGERETSNDSALPTDDTYVLEGTYTDSNGKAIPNVNLVIYSDTPHYVTTNINGDLIVNNLERGNHEIYQVNDTLENIKNMSKELIIKNAVTSSKFTTKDTNIVFTNNNSIKANFIGYNSYCDKLIGNVWEYDYVGQEQVFNPICGGTYKLETWGAQGGTVTNTLVATTYDGGYGAYSVGEIDLVGSESIYINVGGAGKACLKYGNTTSGTKTCGNDGGYNGGGSTRPICR